MQGTLSEIDIRSILQLIELGQRTGELLVEAYYPNYNRYFQTQKNLVQPVGNNASSLPRKLRWIVFFVNGKIAYATEIKQDNLSRLKDYLYRYQGEIEIDDWYQGTMADNKPPEYAYLWSLLEQKLLTIAECRVILQNMIQEIIFDLFSLHQGSFVFHQRPPLAPQLMNLEIEPLVSIITKQLQEWKQLRPEIKFPTQCPIINQPENLKKALPLNTYQGLYRSCDGKTSLRQLSRYLNRDVLTISKAIYPFLQKGWVQLVDDGNFHLLESQNRAKTSLITQPELFCLDDDLFVVKTVEGFLEQAGYKITVMTDPREALSKIFEIKPQLILCDLVMPNLDGYEICAMLRGSSLFREIPIIILTGKDSYLDRIVAQLLGATDYLTKPFGKNELLTLVEKYLDDNISPGSLDG